MTENAEVPPVEASAAATGAAPRPMAVRAKARPAEKKQESETIGLRVELGRRPHKVVVVERKDRRGALQIRFAYLGRPYKLFLRPPHPQSLWRIDAKGRRVRDVEAEGRVLELMGNVRSALTGGTDPLQVLETAAARSAEEAPPAALTLSALLDLAVPDVQFLRRNSGDQVADRAALRSIFGVDSAEAREFAALARRGAQALERVLLSRGAPAHCEAIQPGDWTDAARLMAREFQLSAGRRGSGRRTIERALAAVARCGRWMLARPGTELETFCGPKTGWKAELAKFMGTRSSAPLRVHRPRYEVEEAARLMALVLDPDACLDMRVRLAVVLGFPLRLGQVVSRAWRSCLNLQPLGRYGCGRLEVPASGKKPATSFDLDPVERRWVDAALSGCLSQLEAAHRAGLLPDYPLFPAGRMRRGVVMWSRGDAAPRPLSDRRLQEWFAQAEQWVGITHDAGRGWYGLRRICADLAPLFTNDEDVRNLVGAWLPEGTRANTYRDLANVRLQSEVARVRVALREHLLQASPQPAAHTLREKPELVGRDSVVSRAKREAQWEAEKQERRRRRGPRTAARGQGADGRRSADDA